jgi:hypothetical protein
MYFISGETKIAHTFFHTVGREVPHSSIHQKEKFLSHPSFRKRKK